MPEVRTSTVAEFDTEDGEVFEVREVVNEENEGYDGLLVISVDSDERLRLTYDEALALVESLQQFL
jgi:hypothetical protein